MGELVVVLVTVLVTTAATAAVRPVLARRAPDVPNVRSSHLVVVPRGGGVGVVLGIVVGAAVSSILLEPRAAFPLFAAPLAVLAVLGLAEDLIGLSVRTRLTGQVLIVTGCATLLAFIAGLDMAIPLSWLLILLVIASGTFYVNAANFMDGINGISGFHGLLAGSYFAILGVSESSVALTVAGLLTASAFAAFLPWNFPRARLFLGDVGSYLLGGAVWLGAVGAVLIGAPPVVAAAPLVVYSADVLSTLGRRLLAGRSLAEAHREHTYQRIQQITGSHATAALACTAATALCTGLGWWVRDGLSHATGASLMVATAAGYLVLPWLMGSNRRRHVAVL